MKQAIIHHEGAGAVASAGHSASQTGGGVKAAPRPVPGAGVIQLGVDVHSALYVVAALHGHGAVKPPRRFLPREFVPWVEALVRAGHGVHVVYEACGFGFGLCRVPKASDE